MFAAAAAASASAKELSWRSIDVRARLDAQGALHVVETQAMVFTGDWNGGERSFSIRPGQSIALVSLARIDPDGTRHALSQGGLSAVDEWAWSGDNVLRWRSRLPSDPEFASTELVYEIAYVLSGVLVKQGETYLLDHNFGLPTAEWPIRRLKVSLELDPVWKPEGAFPGVYESGVLVSPVELHRDGAAFLHGQRRAGGIRFGHGPGPAARAPRLAGGGDRPPLLRLAPPGDRARPVRAAHSRPERSTRHGSERTS